MTFILCIEPIIKPMCVECDEDNEGKSPTNVVENEKQDVSMIFGVETMIAISHMKREQENKGKSPMNVGEHMEQDAAMIFDVEPIFEAMCAKQK